MQSRLFNIDTILITKRLVLKRFRETDGEAFYQLVEANYEQLYPHFTKMLNQVKDEESASIYVIKNIANWLLQEAYMFGIWENSTARLVGMIRFFNLDWSLPKAEVGYFIDKDFGGKGLMTEAMKMALDFAFNQLALERISLRTSMENVASQRLARKSGFLREGDLRNDHRRLSGELTDVMLFGLSRSEYMSHK
ncbi:MAG TPA: GNAT family protein [Saprospiraceae bacterium]|nr:GNAT family protein [Saprospiraceae bacterium]HMQ84557.1 GNAT family protein [Saprospiraceae bacterium]